MHVFPNYVVESSCAHAFQISDYNTHLIILTNNCSPNKTMKTLKKSITFNQGPCVPLLLIVDCTLT